LFPVILLIFGSYLICLFFSSGPTQIFLFCTTRNLAKRLPSR